MREECADFIAPARPLGAIDPGGAMPARLARRTSMLVSRHVPIGSGVTGAACQVLVERRLCNAAVLSVRCPTYTPERWAQFWSRVDRNGFPMAA